MTAFAFDTYEMVQRFETSGFSPEQAKSLTSALKDTVTATSGDLATKGDLLVIRNEIAGVKSELKEGIASLNANVAMLKWSIGVIILGVLSLVIKAYIS